LDLQDTAIDESLLRESPQVLHKTNSRNAELDATTAWGPFSLIT